MQFIRSDRTDKAADHRIRIMRFGFESSMPNINNPSEDQTIIRDAAIGENLHFEYPVLVPANWQRGSSCILLLHGLNERHWNKYLSWAEYLALHTCKPVILFPIAFHMNRGPEAWGDPRSMIMFKEIRRRETGNTGSLSFANAVFSTRMTEQPLRFHHSGIQTIQDITILARQIMAGKHPLFPQGTHLDFFAYSIGAFIAQILLLANPRQLFSPSRLFIFCGGSIFRHMYGESKHIMDRLAYERLLSYYCQEWLTLPKNHNTSQQAEILDLNRVFSTMILPDLYREERESGFHRMKNRMAGVALRKDKVMPFQGVEACVGRQVAGECFELMDFPFAYSHEAPFPSKGIDEEVAAEAFIRVFRKSADFLS